MTKLKRVNKLDILIISHNWFIKLYFANILIYFLAYDIDSYGVNFKSINVWVYSIKLVLLTKVNSFPWSEIQKYGRWIFINTFLQSEGFHEYL